MRIILRKACRALFYRNSPNRSFCNPTDMLIVIIENTCAAFGAFKDILVIDSY